MNKRFFEFDEITVWGDKEKIKHQLDTAIKLKALVRKLFPDAENFNMGPGIDSHTLYCRIKETKLTISIKDDGVFQYHCSYCDLERLKGWMLYGGFCFSFKEISDDIKAVKQGLQRRGFIAA